MKLKKKITALIVCASVMVSSSSVFAADSGTWSLSATPYTGATPKQIVLDYCSNGYTAKITSKSGNSPLNTVTIVSDSHSAGTVAQISEVNVSTPIDKPTDSNAIVTFTVSLSWTSGYAAGNNGTIARK